MRAVTKQDRLVYLGNPQTINGSIVTTKDMDLLTCLPRGVIGYPTGLPLRL